MAANHCTTHGGADATAAPTALKLSPRNLCLWTHSFQIASAVSSATSSQASPRTMPGRRLVSALSTSSANFHKLSLEGVSPPSSNASSRQRTATSMKDSNPRGLSPSRSVARFKTARTGSQMVEVDKRSGFAVGEPSTGSFAGPSVFWLSLPSILPNAPLTCSESTTPEHSAIRLCAARLRARVTSSLKYSAYSFEDWGENRSARMSRVRAAFK
mmetsp:Transcript_7723/g.21093  ORF Transcript_7723/g.21093 Transcript_7723/m.21093 type:complete len:214 (+) Transcript_7723:899-1540(+)